MEKVLQKNKGSPPLIPWHKMKKSLGEMGISLIRSSATCKENSSLTSTLRGLLCKTVRLTEIPLCKGTRTIKDHFYKIRAKFKQCREDHIWYTRFVALNVQDARKVR
ncbi:hypothetical protein OIU76_023575 [Salix suchowensis]|nr:hypothetical protein OIU76_023575 [Salix suchowensis]